MIKHFRRHLNKHLDKFTKFLFYLIVVLDISTVFLFLIFIGSKFYLALAGHEYNIHQIVSSTEAVKEVQNVTIHWFIYVFIIFFIVVAVLIAEFIHRHPNLNKNTFNPSIIEFVMTISFCIIELFSICYGFIGSTINSASVGIVLIIVVTFSAALIFLIMLWSHMRFIIHYSVYIKSSSSSNNNRLRKMSSVLSKQNNQLRSMNNENSTLKKIIRELKKNN